MAKKQVYEESIKEIKKSLEKKKLVIGAETTLKQLRAGNLLKVFLSSNCPETLKKEFEHYAKLSKTELKELRYPNDELGVICKKPFSISVLGVMKE